MQDLLLLAGFMLFAALISLGRIVPPKYRDQMQIVTMCSFIILILLADILVFNKTIVFCPEYKLVHIGTLICGNLLSAVCAGVLIHIFKP